MIRILNNFTSYINYIRITLSIFYYWNKKYHGISLCCRYNNVVAERLIERKESISIINGLFHEGSKTVENVWKKRTRGKSLSQMCIFGFQYLFLLDLRDIIYVQMQFCKKTELVVKTMNVELQVEYDDIS